jgi:hypothetical protein
MTITGTFSLEFPQLKSEAKAPVRLGLRLRNAALAAIAAAAVAIGGPAFLDTRLSKDIQTEITRSVDDLYIYVREVLNYEREDAKVECKKDGDNIYIIITPRNPVADHNSAEELRKLIKK